MESINRDQLYSDGDYRFRYFAKFVDFGPDDVEAIGAVSARLKEAVKAVVDAVYVKLFTFDITKATFLEKNEGYGGALQEKLNELTLDDGIIKYRKLFLQKYFNRLLSGPFDDHLLKYLDHVAKFHTDTPDKKSKVHVDYIHLAALLAHCETILINGIYSLNLDRELERRAVVAFSKVIWIQNDYFAKYYAVESVDYARKHSRKALEKGSETTLSQPDVLRTIAMATITGALAYLASSFILRTKS